jgi:Fe-S oxidoreductase
LAKEDVLMNPVSDLGPAGFILFWGLTALAAGIFFYRGSQLLRYLYLGRKEKEYRNIFGRGLKAAGDFVAQVCQWKSLSSKDRAAVGHVFMVWGFILFVVYYTLFIVVASGFGISETMEGNRFYAVYCWIMDIVAPFIVIGAGWGIIRRYIVKPARLKGQQTWEAMLILITVLIHPITHLGKIATQIAAGAPPAGLGIATPPLSTALSYMYSGASIVTWHTVWFWSHWVFVLFVLGIIGFTRYLHIIAIVNDFFRPEFKARMSPIDLKDQTTFGASRVNFFTRKQLLDVYACVTCGRCQEACPAASTGKPLNPRLIIRDIKTNLLNNGPLMIKNQQPVMPLIGEGGEGSVSEEALWECTTCWACMEECPVYIEHVPKIIDMRRSLVQNQAKFPQELLSFFDNMEQRSNPWGIAPGDRAKWAAEISAPPFEAGKTEYLYYVGCAGSFDARNRQVTLAVARILNAAGISWGIFGRDEKCCGDSLRRLGNEYIFDKMAAENVKWFKEKGVKKIITQCPHCFDTFKNDYQQFGLEAEVIHHSDLINRLIQQNKLKLNGEIKQDNIVFHDSCYLGRHNEIYNSPREALTSVTGKAPAEMERKLRKSFCCGAGGGRMWMEEKIGKRINVERVEEALTKNPDTVCVCCPYCMTMFEDGLKDKKVDEKVHVRDLAEIVVKAMGEK